MITRGSGKEMMAPKSLVLIYRLAKGSMQSLAKRHAKTCHQIMQGDTNFVKNIWHDEAKK